MSAKVAINDKLQGSVGAITTYLRCGGVVNNQTKNGLGLLVSLRVKKKLKSVNILQRYKQDRGCLVQILRLLAVWWPGAQSAFFFFPCCLFRAVD